MLVENNYPEKATGRLPARSAVLHIFLFCFAILSIACSDKSRYDAARHLTETEANQFKKGIIRYVAALPKKGNDQTKFESRFDDHYNKQLNLVKLDKYFLADDGYYYFETSRIAPSFKVKRVATGGRLKYASDGSIAEYEEIYRTWKMEEEELAKKTGLLFRKMVAGDDLTPYLTANSEEEYIEFPDHQVRYDKEQRKWIGNEVVLQARP